MAIIGCIQCAVRDIPEREEALFAADIHCRVEASGNGGGRRDSRNKVIDIVRTRRFNNRGSRGPEAPVQDGGPLMHFTTRRLVLAGER